MLRVTINGRDHFFAEGTTILRALQEIRIDIPALCDDPRLKPIGGCRLCSVEIKGATRPVPACNTSLADGMEIQTHNAELDATRRTNLKLLARDYPHEDVLRFPDKPFHRWLAAYGLEKEPSGSRQPDLRDASHPYIHVDMSRCIYCFRCARICDEVQGQFVWQIWNRGDATRIVPDSETTLAESSCVACGACVDSCPSGALEDKTILSHGAPTKWTKTTCPYCGVGCEMNVGTRGNQIVQIKPVLDAPVNKGHLCSKGRYAFGFVHSNERITEPMLRDNGAWRKATWDEAIQFIASKLQRITREHGADSVGLLGSARATNEENYLAQKFARVVLGTNNVDCCARVCHAPSAAALKEMFGTGAATNSFDDIERAQTILLCGANATENHPIVGARIKQARLRGANLLVIEPRRIELAHYATVHLQLKLGTNVPLLNALANVVIEEHLFDETAVRERISGWPEYLDFIRAWTPERAAAICGLEAETIRRAAHIFAGTKPSICFHGLGLTEHEQGTESVMGLINLALITGNFGKPGTGINPLRGQNNVQGAAHMGCEPEHLAGYARIAEARERFEKIWKTPLPSRAGLNLMQMIDAAARKQLKALWAIGYDIALTNPDASATCDALRSLDLLIVQDMFPNVLADFAHVFLPVASGFEKDGTFMNAERRIQRVRKVVEPPGNSKADWEIICAAARAMGFEQFFNFNSPQEIWNEIRTTWSAGAGISYKRLDQQGLQWPCPSEAHPGTALLHVETFAGNKRAPLQRIDFRATGEMVSAGFPFLLTTGRTLYQFNAGTMTMHTPNAELRPKDLLDISPEDARALNLENGEAVRIQSRYGATILPVRINPAMRHGEVFATFHTREAFLNLVTDPARDHRVDTPQYKVTAVRLEKTSRTTETIQNVAPLHFVTSGYFEE